jgi:hypothetical protein
VLSDFFTRRTGAEKADVMGRMMLAGACLHTLTRVHPSGAGVTVWSDSYW